MARVISPKSEARPLGGQTACSAGRLVDRDSHLNDTACINRTLFVVSDI